MSRSTGVLLALGVLALLASLLPWATRGAAESPAPAANETAGLSAAELESQGLALFRAKGCATCHRHAAVGGQQFDWRGAPELTNYKVDATFVRRWLRDPGAVRPGTVMPNLGLSDAEIEALIAFLSANAR